MFEDLRQEFDYILIDARTGITDSSRIITAQLPDILVFLFTANEQSFLGASNVARRAADAQNALAIDRSRLLLLPVPARFEIQLEHKISAWWRDRFARDLAEFYEPWAFLNAPAERLVQATTIPYVPFWSFGERLSVVEDLSADPLGVNYSLENIAALLAHRLGQTRLLLESRDEFVSSARRLAQRRDKSHILGVRKPFPQGCRCRCRAEAKLTSPRSSDAFFLRSGHERPITRNVAQQSVKRGD